MFHNLSRKRIQKDNITFNDNYTVSYREYRRYYFEPSMSAGNESDIITIPNMLVLVRPLCSAALDLLSVLRSSPTSVLPGRGSDDGEPVPVDPQAGQLHHQRFWRGGLSHQVGGRADVGLRQQAGRFPQEVSAITNAYKGEVRPLQRGKCRPASSERAYRELNTTLATSLMIFLVLVNRIILSYLPVSLKRMKCPQGEDHMTKHPEGSIWEIKAVYSLFMTQNPNPIFFFPAKINFSKLVHFYLTHET